MDYVVKCGEFYVTTENINVLNLGPNRDTRDAELQPRLAKVYKDPYKAKEVADACGGVVIKISEGKS